MAVPDATVEDGEIKSLQFRDDHLDDSDDEDVANKEADESDDEDDPDVDYEAEFELMMARANERYAKLVREFAGLTTLKFGDYSMYDEVEQQEEVCDDSANPETALEGN